MSAERRMRWDGWGERPAGEFPDAGLAMLTRELGLSGRGTSLTENMPRRFTRLVEQT